MYILKVVAVFCLILVVRCEPGRPLIPVNGTAGGSATAAEPLEVGVGGQPLTGDSEGNGTMEFDFVNLPGYGVVDDANSTLNGTFSCFERRYGYYADVSRSCQMFHLCYPVREPSGNSIVYQRFSFVCSDNAFFDQAHLVCVENETSIACEDSEHYYEPSNDRLMESLQATQPGMFATEDESINGTSSLPSSSDSSSSSSPSAPSSLTPSESSPSEQAYHVYNLYNDWY
ncbi:uncharacterized protein LOC128395942 [Panonychus citri]|uniref:uncharacterized protein LOC128395942 n=1 Tax=Panonychus citri TaxID=50023 RepID=UPI002307E03B|nr:uncharacterized protein LOC128395942 [Panonychus citri]